MRPVVLVEGKKAEHNPDHNRLTLKILFPKPNGEKAISGNVVLINGDVPQILVRTPKAVTIIIDEQKGEGGDAKMKLR